MTPRPWRAVALAAAALALAPVTSRATCADLGGDAVQACREVESSLGDFERAWASSQADPNDPAKLEAARAARDGFVQRSAAFNGPLEARHRELKARLSALTPEERTALDQVDLQLAQGFFLQQKAINVDPQVEALLRNPPEHAAPAEGHDGVHGEDKEHAAADKTGPVTRGAAQTAAAAADLRAGNPGGAVKTLAPYVESHPGDAGAVSLLAQAKMAGGDRAGALADARRALQLNPADQEARRIVSELERLEDARRRVDGVKVDFGPEKGPSTGISGGGTRTAAPPVRGGGAAPGAGVSVPAVGVVPPAVRDLFRQADDKFRVNDDAGALMALREAADLDPKRTEAWDEIAEISNKDGDYEGAAAAAEKALAIDPGDARALRAKAYAEFQLGDYRRALADAERAVALDPGNGLGYLYRAMAEEKLGDKAAAIRDYREAMRLDPALAPAALEGLARLEPAAPRAPAHPLLIRVGVLGGSGALLLLGLLGTASGRRLAREYTRRLKTFAVPAPAEEPRRPAAVSEFATVALGSVIGGHYRVTGELGRGGMGAVYKAQDETLNRPVAIKQLLSDGRGNPEDAARLLQEARLVARLQHPNIAEIYSVISERDLLLVFEFVDGESLDKTLRRNRKLSPARAREILAGVCAALDCAHARGIIHRDLKPANVMIAADGSAKVMDFGIAHQSRGGATVTRTLTASGTPPYMAPEQFLGSVSRASDLYSAAVMAYELLTGSRPFDGPDFVEPKLRKEFLPPTRLERSLPAAADEFFARALDPDPLKRPAGAAEFSRAFGAALAGAADPT